MNLLTLRFIRPRLKWWIAILALTASSTMAQTVSQNLRAIGGGGQSTDNRFKITGSIGQPAIGLPTGGVFRVASGFWAPFALPVAPPSPACLVVACPTNLTEACTNASGTMVHYAVGATNVCAPSVPVTLSCVPPSGSMFAPGTTLVNCQAIGLVGNSLVTNHCQFPVTVLSNCPPPACVAIFCPTNMTVDCTNALLGTRVSFAVRGTNFCFPPDVNPVTITCQPPSGSPFPPGTTPVYCEARSLVGPGLFQTNQCLFTVTVQSNCPPTGCVANLLVNGSFESPRSAEGWIDVPGSSSLIPGWTTLLNGVEYYNPTANRWGVRDGFAREGDFCVDLTPFERTGGGIAQTFATTPGRGYRVSFFLSTMEREGRDGTGSISVSAGGVTEFYTAENHSPVHRWHLKQFGFVATDASTTLAFTSTNNWVNHFVMIDDVRVTDCCLELICPPQVTAECQTPNGAPVAWTVAAVNYCAPQDLTVVCTPAPGSWFPPGRTMVTCTASGSGVTQTCTFPVIVEGSCGGLCEENLLVNGSFEQPGRADGYRAIPVGSDPALLPGWTVLPAGVEYYDGTSLHPAAQEAGAAADGGFALDLAYVFSINGGGLEQFVATTPGESYTLSFSAGTVKYLGRVGTGRLEVSVGSTVRSYDLVNFNNHIRWDKFTLTFVAQSPSTIVKLTTTDNATNHAVEIDNVRLTRCPSPCVRTPEDLVYWLPFDEPGGLTAYNAVGTTYNGRLFNGNVSDGAGPTRLSSGHVQRALEFDGTNDWVCVGDAPHLNVGTNDFTFDAWVRLAPGATNGGARLIAGKFRPGADGLRFGMDGGYLFLQYNNPLAIHYWPDAVRLPDDGQWHLVAVTVRRDEISGGQFYIDGVPTGSFATRPLAGDLPTPGPLGVGGMLGREAWSGGIDEFEFFRRSLRAEEIRALYEAGSAGKCRIQADIRWDVPICRDTNSAEVPATIRNFGAQPRTVTYQLQPISCDGAAPAYALTFSPAMGTVTVPPHGEVSFPVRITLPTTMPCGVPACYELLVHDGTELVAVSPHRQLLRGCNTCIISEARVPVTNLLSQTLPPIRVNNLGNTPLFLKDARWRVLGPNMRLDRRVVSLNNQQPGPIMLPPGLVVPAGGALDLLLTVAFTSFQPGQVFTVILEADVDSTGLNALTSFELVNVLPSPAPPSLTTVLLPNGALSLQWNDNGAVLEQAPTPLGPWVETPGQGATDYPLGSGDIVELLDAEAQFFRLRR